MTYSTGSGTYTALMAAVLAHAVTDGWTTSASNWPINKGVVRGVDWATFTATEVDRTLLGGATRTTRYIRIAVGTSPANATANATADATSAQVANMDYTITAWHIFSDPTVSDHIHVVCNFSNGINADCWTQFSFGALDKHGMTHTGTAYATANPKRGWSHSAFSPMSNAVDYALGPWGGGGSPFTGRAGYTFSNQHNGRNALSWLVDPTVNPLPGAGWPLADVLQNATQVINPIQPDFSAPSAGINPNNRVGLLYSFQYSAWAQQAIPQPYSGAVSMAPLPLLVLQNLTAASQIMYLGSFPNVRACGMEGYADATIITFGAEEWMIFPMLRQTPWAGCFITDIVSSGRSGYAFKKVP